MWLVFNPSKTLVCPGTCQPPALLALSPQGQGDWGQTSRPTQEPSARGHHPFASFFSQRSSAPAWFWGCQDAGDSISILKKLSYPCGGGRTHVRGMIVAPWVCLMVQPGQARPLCSPVVLRLPLCSHWPPPYCPRYLLLPRSPDGLLASSLPSSSLGLDVLFSMTMMQLKLS